MAMLSEVPRDRFRLGMLLCDTRYRALTIQVIAAFAFAVLIGWLFFNTVANLSAPGKDFNFAFLGSQAGWHQLMFGYYPVDMYWRPELALVWNGIVWERLGFIAPIFFICCFAMPRYSQYLKRKLRTGIEGIT